MKHDSKYRPVKSLAKLSSACIELGLLLILFLGLTGLVLNRAFQESIAASVEERLQLQVYAVLGVAEPDTDMSFFVPDLEEARFSQIDSGLYAFIFNQQANEVWRSPSAVNMNPMDLKRGIAESCDTYFYDLAFRLGIDRIAPYLRQFGFGCCIRSPAPYSHGRVLRPRCRET